MKKAILFSAVLLLLCCAASAMSKSRDTVEANGFIQWFGNSPVEYAGFKTDDGKLYTLEVAENAKFKLKDITRLNGHLLHIEGKVRKSKEGFFQELKDGVFYVEKYEDLSPEISNEKEIIKIN